MQIEIFTFDNITGKACLVFEPRQELAPRLLETCSYITQIRATDEMVGSL